MHLKMPLSRMINSKHPKFKKNIAAAFFIVSLLFLGSCGNEAGPSAELSITFPTSQSVVLRYADFIDFSGSGRNYDSIGVVEERIVGTTPLAGRTAFLHRNQLSDTAGNITVDTSFYAYDNNNKDQWVYLNSIEDFVGDLGTFQLTGFPSGWYPFLKTSAEQSKNYTILPPTPLSFQIDTLTVNATVRAVGNLRGKETISVQGRSYEAIRLVITFTINANISGFAIPEASILQYVWCANNIGIVKFETTSATIGIPPFIFTTPNAKQELISVIGN